MIICQCNVITDQDFESVVIDMLSDAPEQTLTPGRVIRALNARRQCSGCLPALNNMIDGCKKRCGNQDCPRKAMQAQLQAETHTLEEGEFV